MKYRSKNVQVILCALLTKHGLSSWKIKTIVR